MPCIGSTTTPTSRRSSPHTCSRSSASWRPSTQIRLAAATRAGPTGPAIDPDAVTAGAARADDGGAAQRHRLALEQEAARLPREVALVLPAVAQGHRRRAPRDDVAAEPARPVLDDHPDGHLDLAVAHGPAGVGHLLEDVAFVGHGDPIQAREPAAVAERRIAHGELTRHITAIAVAALAGLGLTACARRRRRRRLVGRGPAATEEAGDRSRRRPPDRDARRRGR